MQSPMKSCLMGRDIAALLKLSREKAYVERISAPQDWVRLRSPGMFPELLPQVGASASQKRVGSEGRYLANLRLRVMEGMAR